MSKEKNTDVGVIQRLFVRTVGGAPQSPPQGDGCSSSQIMQGPDTTGRKARQSGGCPVVGANANAGVDAQADCPVISPDFDPRNLMPTPANEPAPGQSQKLSTARAASSIPIGAPDLPQHQTEGTPVWVYPSEQMFYNAMKRKGWQPKEADMKPIVAIHNTVNERAWSEVLQWERLHGDICGQPRLRKFEGKPQKYSPKARLLNMLGYKLPFDRHDWIVDRCGRDVRYVIDFYNAAPLPDMPVAMHLDVRPALDSFSAVWDRLRMQMRWVGSGRWLGEQSAPRNNH